MVSATDDGSGCVIAEGLGFFAVFRSDFGIDGVKTNGFNFDEYVVSGGDRCGEFGFTGGAGVAIVLAELDGFHIEVGGSS